MSPPKPQRPERVSHLLSALLQKSEWEERIHIHAVFTFWGEVVGNKIAEHAQPSIIRGTVLWVQVSDPVWMQQLHLQKLLLLKKINQRLGSEMLTDIRYQLDRASKTIQKQEEQKQDTGPDQAQVRAFEQLTSAIKNEDIKNALTRFWKKVETRK